MTDARVAIYWDFENVHACVLDEVRGDGAYRQSAFKPQEAIVDVDPVVEYALTFGSVTINRAYANWQWFGKYRGELQEHAVDLVQMFPLSGTKNGADIRLAIDVIEDLHQHPHITHVLVVAGDSDFVGLAQKCRKMGRTVLGVGVARSNGRLRAAFDEFRYYRTLVTPPAVAATDVPLDEAEDLDDARDLLVRAIRRLAAGRGEPWVVKAAVRPMLVRLDPSFTEKAYGFPDFDRLLDAVRDTVGRRVGVHDHELAVLADLGDAPEPTSAIGAAPPDDAGAAAIARRLRKVGIRLPFNVEVLWATPQTVISLFAEQPDQVYRSSQALQADLVCELRSRLEQVDDADGSKMRSLIYRAHGFELLGEDRGLRLVTDDAEQLTEMMVRSVISYLPDVDLDDIEDITTVLCGSDAPDDRIALIRSEVESAVARRTEL